MKIEQVKISELKPDPRNARLHNRANIDAIKKSLLEFGQHAPLVVQKGSMMVIVGNGRLEAARELGWTDIDCLVVKDSDSEAIRRSLADNAVGDLAEWNYDILEELSKLENLQFDNIAGFENFEVVPTDPNKEWQDMPEFDQKDKMAFRTIYVHFKNQEDINKFAKLVKQKITEKTKYVWYPEIEIERYIDKRYEAKQS